MLPFAICLHDIDETKIPSQHARHTEARNNAIVIPIVPMTALFDLHIKSHPPAIGGEAAAKASISPHTIREALPFFTRMIHIPALTAVAGSSAGDRTPVTHRRRHPC
jgi:hypothetical protein